MSVVTMTYGGQDLSDVLMIHDIRRDIGNEAEVGLSDAPRLGAMVSDYREGAKYITVEFSIWTPDRNPLKHRLAGIWRGDEERRLSFSDEPDKYYMARRVGKVEMREVLGYRSTGSVTFLIPDGVAHSTAYRRFANPTVASDKITFDLVNNGNVDAYPIVTVKHNAENGYVGLVNTSGALEVGNREEADATTVQKSQILWDYRDGAITTGLAQASKNVAILNDKVARLGGSVGTVSLWGRQHLQVASRGPQSDHQATSLSWDIAGGSLNDYLWWRQIFWLGSSNQYGYIKVTVSDDQGRFLYGVETYKRSQGLTCEYNFMASDGRGGFHTIKQWTFTGTAENDHNPFNEGRGWSDLKRNDDVVTVFWWGTYQRFVVPELKGRQSAKVHVAFGAMGDRPLVSHMYLDGIYYQKDFVTSWVDVPNRYPIGSTLVLDSETDRVVVDGIERLSDLVHGSSFLKIPPGNSKLEVYCSSWLRTKPTVVVSFEERWL